MSFPDGIFKAYDIRGIVGTELTTDTTYAIGCAIAQWLPVAGAVAVGRDMRLDSKDLANALINGLRSQGRDVIDIGEVTSDMIYFAVGNFDLAGGVVVTASHNTGDYNGVKIYRDKVTPVGLDSGLAEIRELAKHGNFEDAPHEGSLEYKDITEPWVNHAISLVDPSSWPKLHIAIDAGNGMAGAILPSVLKRLPIATEQLYFELDGTFPNHEANPQKPENLKDLAESVRVHNCDFGIAFDGDGDRAGFVDDKGRPVLGTDIISIVANLILKRFPGSKIVHDVRTSRATRELIREWGGEPVRTKAGRVYIGALVREIGSTFGGETTGHLFFADNYDADSGLIAALFVIQAISESGKTLSELVDEYRHYVMPPEINFETSAKDSILNDLKVHYADYSQDELDGLTVEAETFWFNLRGSNTEPLLRLNIEGVSDDIVQKELRVLQDIVNRYS
ncbi:phosphomannomutase/phosphoglucomutase [Candidatus Saccharibacteria bacterium]|nr:phosphomannomutase/phosphoglucomutase [Candidatus Saccharibacteria bacterium]